MQCHACIYVPGIVKATISMHNYICICRNTCMHRYINIYVHTYFYERTKQHESHVGDDFQIIRYAHIYLRAD